MPCKHKYIEIGTINNNRIIISWCSICGTMEKEHTNIIDVQTGETVKTYLIPEKNNDI